MKVFKPHRYQREALQFLIDNPAAGLFQDMGMGKTVTVLSYLDVLKNDYLELGKCLIIAPKRVAEDTWPTEIRKWKHLENLSFIEIRGTPKQRQEALTRDADLYIITRDLIAWLVDYLNTDWMFDTVILDELSSFKSHQSQRFKKLRTVRPRINRIVGLTGTPAPNGYMDLWSQIFLLDRGERLGKTITEFRRNYFHAWLRPSFTEYEIKEGAQTIIDKQIEDICLSMKAQDYLPMKEPTYIDRVVDLSVKERRIYNKMERDALIELEGEGVITALSAAAVSNKLLQLANGAIYDENKKAIEIHDKKLQTLEELIEEAKGEPVLVFYSYKSDVARIQARIPEARKLETEKDISDWNAQKIPVMVAHPASAGHGLNLQQGGSIIIWFGLPWSLELYLQANARLFRQGQTKAVRIYHLITNDTMDGEVIKALQVKNTTQEQLLNSLKARLKGVTTK